MNNIVIDYLKGQNVNSMNNHFKVSFFCPPVEICKFVNLKNNNVKTDNF